MEFVFLGAVVVALRVVEIGHFPIQIAKMKTQVFQGRKEVQHPISIPSNCTFELCAMTLTLKSLLCDYVMIERINEFLTNTYSTMNSYERRRLIALLNRLIDSSESTEQKHALLYIKDRILQRCRVPYPSQSDEQRVGVSTVHIHI